MTKVKVFKIPIDSPDDVSGLRRLVEETKELNPHEIVAILGKTGRQRVRERLDTRVLHRGDPILSAAAGSGGKRDENCTSCRAAPRACSFHI
jgi:Amidohydrolase ring-opening protein (Amido_AtzD_TrzD)